MIKWNDPFIRANSSGLGANYTAFGNAQGDWNVASDLAEASTNTNDCGTLLNAIAIPSKYRLRMVFTTVDTAGASTSGSGFMFQANAGTNSFYRVSITNANGSAVELCNAGSFSTMGTNATNWVNGDILDVLWNGGSLYSIYRNNTFLYSFTDSTLSSGGVGPGFSSSVTAVATVSLFQLDDLMVLDTFFNHNNFAPLMVN